MNADTLLPICKCIFACNQGSPSVRLSSYRIAMKNKIGFSILQHIIAQRTVHHRLGSSAPTEMRGKIEMSFSSFQLIALDWIAERTYTNMNKSCSPTKQQQQQQQATAPLEKKSQSTAENPNKAQQCCPIHIVVNVVIVDTLSPASISLHTTHLSDHPSPPPPPPPYKCLVDWLAYLLNRWLAACLPDWLTGCL